MQGEEMKRVKIEQLQSGNGGSRRRREIRPKLTVDSEHLYPRLVL